MRKEHGFRRSGEITLVHDDQVVVITRFGCRQKLKEIMDRWRKTYKFSGRESTYMLVSFDETLAPIVNFEK